MLKRTGNMAISPKAFICHSSEDNGLSERIARDLIENGIEVWLDRWELKTGDSLRRKIDDGIEGCDFFIAVITPRSLERPWVQIELDAALVLEIEGKCVLKPILCDVSVNELPATLRPKVCLILDNYIDKIQLLINECFGKTEKPHLGNRAMGMSHEDEQNSKSNNTRDESSLAIDRALLQDLRQLLPYEHIDSIFFDAANYIEKEDSRIIRDFIELCGRPECEFLEESVQEKLIKFRDAACEYSESIARNMTLAIWLNNGRATGCKTLGILIDLKDMKPDIYDEKGDDLEKCREHYRKCYDDFFRYARRKLKV